MAYAALVSLSQTLDKILNNIPDQYHISSLQKLHLIAIHEYTIFLLSFLEEFPENPNLESQIRDAANEAEDIIEYFMLETFLAYRSMESTIAPSKVKLKHYPSSKSYELQLKEASEKIYSISSEVMDIKKSFRAAAEVEEEEEEEEEEEQSDFSGASSFASTRKNDMVAFDDHLIAVKGRLCGESSKLQVIPVCGMGGIGKTTLARSAYDDQLTIEYFDIRAWISVSQDCSYKKVLSDLCFSIKVVNSREDVYKALKGRRYLIVMDDIWTTEVWDYVKMMFPDDRNGSRIILTTRLLDLASYVDSSSRPYMVPLMDGDQSWGFLKKMVFADHGSCPPELEQLGKEIAINCSGLPLAIVVVGGLLSVVTRTRASWKKIAQNVRAAVVAVDGRHVERILSLSYVNLPHHLKQCFLYMGSFPEDSEIRATELIKLWVAEGFIRPSESKSLEEGAEEYLAELVRRSLVFVRTRKSNGKIRSCIMHDLVRDMCISKAREEKLQCRIGNFCGPKERVNEHRRTTRTITCIQGERKETYKMCRLLRVLDVVDVGQDSLPPNIFALFHLRYLASNYPTKVPASILNLQNLQTLMIHPFRKMLYNSPACLVCLPPEIWRLPQLRHLISFFFGPLPNPEGTRCPLENLQTLSEATHFICSEKILAMIPNVKKLGITYYGDEYDVDFQLENLARLTQLETLKMKIYGGFAFRQRLNPVFPITLRKLTLIYWLLPWEDVTILGSLPNLQVLKLKGDACEGDVWETNDGEFPRLQYLLISETNLRQWLTESSHFPNLKHMELDHCRYLNEIPEDVGEIPTLEEIVVKNSNKSLEDSARRIGQEQESLGNDALQIRFEHNYY